MRNLILAFLLSLNWLSVFPAQAAIQVDISRNEVVLNFPETATFQLKINNDVEIQSIVLEYGNEQQTCGEVIAKAFPQYTPAKSVSTEWTWDMRQNGSLPPGTQLWWRWRATDANGNETVTDTKTITWLDDVHPWKTVSNPQLTLHYYGISKSFAQEMLNAGQSGLDRNQTEAGLTTDSPIHIYVYPSYDDLKDAILYEPSWLGGQAFSEENIVILGTTGSNAEWDKDTVIHELTHVVVGHFTFSCLGSVAHWLDEGLAVYSEGELSEQFQIPLEQAIEQDSLLSIQILSANFGEAESKVDLSYAESFSIVKYLLDTFGQDKMTSLLIAFRNGATTDEALMQTYGFDANGLEDQWRKAIGAQPRRASAQPTALPSPTFVPTIVPISGGSVPLQATVTPIPTSSFDEQPTQVSPATRVGPPLALTLMLLGVCCAILLVIGIIVLAIIVRAQNAKGGNDAR